MDDNGSESIARKIVRRPRVFNLVQNKSWNALLVESGYIEDPNSVNTHTIIKALKEDPSVIHDWQLLSADDRSSPKWTFGQGESGKFYVGHWPPIGEDLVWDDAYESCAYFILRNIEQTRTHIKR